jgi:starch phosphorylase
MAIGTLDGANAEIRDAVGEDNFFLFGKTVQQVDEIRAAGYHPRELSHGDRDLFRILSHTF